MHCSNVEQCYNTLVESCRAPTGPLGIRLSEWRLQALRRLFARALPSLQLSQQPVTKETATSGASINRESGSNTHTGSDSQACEADQGLSAVIMMQNLSGMDLQFGQAGTDECIALADGTDLPYR